MASFRLAGVVRHFSTTISARAALAKAPIQVFGLEGRYAHALYSAASKQKQLEKVEQELNSVQSLIQQDQKLAGYIANPTVKRTEKRDVLSKVLTDKKMSPITVNLFAAMADNGRLNKMSNVLNAFGKIMSAHRGEIVCSVTTAKPLEASHLKELKTVLQGFLEKGQTLQLETLVDPTIVGGMVVNIGDKYVDMSMASKIKAYTNLLNQAV